MANRKARMRRNKVNSDIRAEGRALQTPKIKKDPMRSLDDEQGMSLQRRARMGARPVSMTGSYDNNLTEKGRRLPKMPKYDDTEVDVSPRAERDDQMMIGKKKGGKIKKMKAGGMAKKGYKKGGKMPDLTGDGKVTQADVLKGRGVFKKGGMAKKGYAKGGMMKKGYKKGGKVRGAGIAQKGVRACKMR